MRRRDFLVGASTYLLYVDHASAQPSSSGCVRSAIAGGDAGRFPTVSSTGVDKIDNLCRSEVSSLNRHFKVDPFFAFYEDGRYENAKADRMQYDPNHKDGAVLLGVNFAKSLARAGDVAIIVVMAHEWAHIKQDKLGKKFVWNVRYELDADQAAGEYLKSKGSDERLGRAASQVFFNMGRNNFTAPSYHGTPNQRADVFRDGFGIETGISERGPR
jgi:hypothetical protein